MPDYYTILGVPRDATPEEIRKAYLDLVRRLHPDRNVLPGETQLFLEVQQAYEVLSNAKRRAEYDATLPAEEPPSPIRLSTFYSRNALLRLDELQLLYVLLEMEVASGESQRPPWNVVLAIDRSTSMQGEKLETVKTAILEWMNAFAPQDNYSVITFSDRAEVIIPSSLRRNVQGDRSRIYAIHAGGGTEIYQGLQAAYEEALRGYSPERVNYIILLTDGHTYGDEQACLELAEQAAKEGILISAIGLGSDWNDVFLDRLASLSGGSAHFASSAEDVMRIFRHLFDQLQKTYADETILDFQVGEGVEISYLFRIHPETSPLPIESPVRLGPLLGKEPLSLLMELRITPSALQGKTAQLLRGTISTTPLSGSTPLRIPLRLSCAVSESPDLTPPPHNLVQALSRVTLYRLQERAQQQAQKGEYTHATRTLHYLASHLLSQGERSLARTILLEADRLQREGKLSEEGKKTIKYGTRALILRPKGEEK
ncbi:MAG: DnaJ domain-containing protein [Anaerolineales bacterium]